MPLASRRARRSTIDIWPGFVDALAQLLMVIIFILLVFTAGQFFLSDALSGRDKALRELQQQISELSDLLALERSGSEELRTRAATLATQLKASTAERDALTTQLAALQAVRADLEKQVGDLAAARTQAETDAGALRDRSKELEARLATAEERTQLAQKEIDARDIRLRALTTQGNEARSRVDELNAAVAALRQQLAQITAALDL